MVFGKKVTKVFQYGVKMVFDKNDLERASRTTTMDQKQRSKRISSRFDEEKPVRVIHEL